MKKFFATLFCALAAFSCVCGFSACSADKDGGAVNLAAITGAQVGIADGFDYYVVPEPAASAKVSAVENLEFAGDLQQLYGGESGYPQAVVVAKTNLTATDFCGKFIAELNKSGSWLSDESVSAQTITDAVKSRLTEGMTPTFNAGNLSKQVIKNCGVNFVNAETCKQEIKEFMQKLNSVSDSTFGEPAENFFSAGGATESGYEGTVKVYAPDGAPALGLAKLVAENPDFGAKVEMQYNIVDASLIQTFVTGAAPAADICVLPVNLAVKLLGKGDKYKLLGTLTHGNLFLLSNSGEKITADNLTTLKGKMVGVVNLAAVPGLTFKLILKNSGIEYTEIV